MSATLAMFRRRITAVNARFFHPLEGSVLSTFDVYSTIMADEDGHIRQGPGMKPCTAFVIADVAFSKGVRVLGVTSERTSAGGYICQTFPDGSSRADHNVIYVGQYNFFTGHERSPWALVPSDKILEVTSTPTQQSHASDTPESQNSHHRRSTRRPRPARAGVPAVAS